MSDLISRQAVMECFKKWQPYMATRLYEFEKELTAIPSLENKGEWIESKERSKHWYCSVCGGIHTDPETGKWRETFDYRYPFCPNCGARMKGDE